MHDFDPFERRLADALRDDADASVGPFEAGSIARAAIAGTGPACHGCPPVVAPHRTVRPGPRHHPARAAALLSSVGRWRRVPAFCGCQSVVPPVPAPSLAALATASPTPSATPSPSPTPLSLDVTWTKVDLAVNEVNAGTGKVAWLGDRFVLRDDDGAISTSLDGATWTVLRPGDPDLGYAELGRRRASVVTSEDAIVGWWNPEDDDGMGDIAGKPPITARDIIRIVRPSADPVDTSPFKGRIESIGIGPKGIVAHVHSDIDTDEWITKKLGLRTNNDWTCCLRDFSFEDGVLQLKRSNGPGLKVVWADEGLEPGDFQDRGFGWYSADGEHWTAMAPNDDPAYDAGTTPTGGLGKVVGVPDGFIATGASPDGACPDPEGSCTGMWYSADGLTWRLLGAAPFDPRLVPWRDGVLATDGDGHAELWTSDGSAELPMAAQLRGTVATGPLGLVSIDDGQVLVSRDGVDYQGQLDPRADGRAGRRRRR